MQRNVYDSSVMEGNIFILGNVCFFSLNKNLIFSVCSCSQVVQEKASLVKGMYHTMRKENALLGETHIPADALSVFLHVIFLPEEMILGMSGVVDRNSVN